MSLYKTIYAPDGTTFEVPPERAADLVLNQGWSNTAPEAEAKPGKKTRKAAKEEAVPTADVSEDERAEAPIESE